MGLSGWNNLLLISIPDLKCCPFFIHLLIFQWDLGEATETNKFIRFVVFTSKLPFLSQPTPIHPP